MLEFLFALVFFISFSESLITGHRPDRIIDGEPADIKDFPYMLDVEHMDNEGYLYLDCGAVIIAPSWALTTAHCIPDIPLRILRVRSGCNEWGRDGTLHGVEKVHIHPKFNKSTYDYNVAVIKVSTPFSSNMSIAVAALTPPAGTAAVVTGWGATSPHGDYPKQLLQATVYISYYETCKHHYPEMTPRMLCAGIAETGRITCYYDNGGPLVVENTLVGLVSKHSCKKYQPSLYTDVAKFHKWITNFIEEK